MRRAQEYIARKQAEFRRHPFIGQLGADLPLKQVVPFVPQVAFFVMAFQDLMKMMGERATDPRLQSLLLQHCEEEKGHDGWFLRDLTRLGCGHPDVAVLFSAPHALTRRATYALVAEALGARDDVERLCLLLTMEATSEVCFGEAHAYFQRAGVADNLVFFAGPHLEAEENHAVFAGPMALILGSIELDPEAFERACGVVDRTYAAFDVMLDGLERLLSSA
jgi:Iron-containing redox enzyme